MSETNTTMKDRHPDLFRKIDKPLINTTFPFAYYEVQPEALVHIIIDKLSSPYEMYGASCLNGVYRSKQILLELGKTAAVSIPQGRGEEIGVTHLELSEKIAEGHILSDQNHSDLGYYIQPKGFSSPINRIICFTDVDLKFVEKTVGFALATKASEYGLANLPGMELWVVDVNEQAFLDQIIRRVR